MRRTNSGSYIAGSPAELRVMKARATAAAIVTLSSVCFLYGVFHAIGPGHGKSVISAYLVANGRTVKRGILLSFLAALLQAVTAIALVSCLISLLTGSGITTDASLGVLTPVSGGFTTAVGAWMVWTSLSRRACGTPRIFASHAHQAHGREPAALSTTDSACGSGCCDRAHRVAPHQLLSETSLPGLAVIIAAIGVRPCSGAIFVLLFANTIGLYSVGVWATLAMALGTAITVSALAVLTLWSKRAAVRLVSLNTRRLDRIYRSMHLAGSVAVFCLGLFLLFASATAEGQFTLR
jgi:nickel/cobalt transporter (NicO) family protein